VCAQLISGKTLYVFSSTVLCCSITNWLHILPLLKSPSIYWLKNDQWCVCVHGDTKSF
jgi:hypothetical protein